MLCPPRKTMRLRPSTLLLESLLKAARILLLLYLSRRCSSFVSTCPNWPRLLQELLALKRAASPIVSCCMLSYLTVLTSLTVNQEQAHTFLTLHIRKRTFDEVSLSDKPDLNKSPV